MPKNFTRIYQKALWQACLPLLPILAVQGRWVRKTVQILPEAFGEKKGRIVGGTRELSVAIIGESTATGVGAAIHEQGMAGQLAQQLASTLHASVRWEVLGRNGLTVAGIKRMVTCHMEGPIDAVVVLTGVNDVVRLTSEGKWIRGICDLVEVLQKKGARCIVFSSVPPVGMFPALPCPLRNAMGVRAKLLDFALREAVDARADASVTCARTVFSTARKYMATDGFHPSALGYAEWAKQIATHIACLPDFHRNKVDEIALDTCKT